VTPSITPSLIPEFIIIGNITITDGANGSRGYFSFNIHNDYGYGSNYYLDWEIISDGITVIDSGFQYIYLESGDNTIEADNNVDFFYPDVAQENLTWSVKVRDENANPKISNEFSSVEVTMNSVDTIGTQTSSTPYDNISINVTAASGCTLYVTTNIRNSIHMSKGGSWDNLDLITGTADYYLSGTIPDDIGANHDMLIQKTAAIEDTLYSNHFTII
jgi:hypothetical protein